MVTEEFYLTDVTCPRCLEPIRIHGYHGLKDPECPICGLKGEWEVLDYGDDEISNIESYIRWENYGLRFPSGDPA